MKKILLATMLMIAWAVLPAQAADVQINVNFNANTGDSQFDGFLRNVNKAAGPKVKNFITDISSTFKVPPKEVRRLIFRQKMQPADVFMVFHIARVSGKPYKKVIKRYRKHRKKGWGAVAASLGIKPGTKKFIILKERIPAPVVKYKVVEVKGSKGSKGSKHKKHKKGSKHKKHKKGSKGSKGS